LEPRGIGNADHWYIIWYFDAFGVNSMAKMTLEALRELVEREVFTIPEAAEYLGLTRQLVSKQVNAGKIPVIRGKFVLKQDLDRYAETFKGTRQKK